MESLKPMHGVPHPDLFGGESPTYNPDMDLIDRLESEGFRLFNVYVEWKVKEDKTMPVVATCADEAEEIALAMVEELTSGWYDEIEAWVSSDGDSLVHAPAEELKRVFYLSDWSGADCDDID